MNKFSKLFYIGLNIFLGIIILVSFSLYGLYYTYNKITNKIESEIKIEVVDTIKLEKLIIKDTIKVKDILIEKTKIKVIKKDTLIEKEIELLEIE